MKAHKGRNLGYESVNMEIQKVITPFKSSICTSLCLLQVDFQSKLPSAGWIFDKGGIELKLRLLFILVRTLIAVLYCENQRTCIMCCR